MASSELIEDTINNVTFWQCLVNVFSKIIAKVVSVMLQLKKPGEDDPRRLIHSFKVALSITLVSAFYYVKPLYDAFDSNPMWIIITVILVSEFSVGNYRDEDLLDTVKKRVITIFAGVLISVSVCIFVYPIWGGDDLHKLVSKNLHKLGDSIEGFGDEYFGTSDGEESNKSKLQAYKSVLNSKQIEESLVNFARWEPCHGPFRYGHPWKQYLKIGSLLRQCAYLIDSLIGFLDYTSKTPSETKRKVEEACIQISKETGKSLKELSVSIQKKISPSYAANPSIEKSKIVAMNLKSILKSGLWEGTNIPLMIVIYLLFDVVSCTEKLAESIHELSIQGKFKKKDNKVAPNYPNCPPHLDEPCHGDQEKNIGVHHVITIN
ncbi:hypothetical protein AHAS_Ahas18G0061500 [Arachis hypogaea]